MPTLLLRDIIAGSKLTRQLGTPRIAWCKPQAQYEDLGKYEKGGLRKRHRFRSEAAGMEWPSRLAAYFRSCATGGLPFFFWGHDVTATATAPPTSQP